MSAFSRGSQACREGNHVIPLKSTSNKKEEIDTWSILWEEKMQDFQSNANTH